MFLCLQFLKVLQYSLLHSCVVLVYYFIDAAWGGGSAGSLLKVEGNRRLALFIATQCTGCFYFTRDRETNVGHYHGLNTRHKRILVYTHWESR